MKTTGIFCRPSCPARKPLEENVEYYTAVKEALFAGFRPCKRCHPLESVGGLPEWAASLLRHIEQDPSVRIKDRDLRTFGVEPATARRFFTKHFKMTFQAYCRSQRLGRAFDEIKSGDPLDDVILGHGFESHSGFREAFFRQFGTSPGKATGEDYIRVAWIETPLGPMITAATENGICLLEFTDRRMLEAQVKTVASKFKLTFSPGENEFIRQVREEIGLYFSGSLIRFSVPIEFPGTEFQVKVWKSLLEIPYGETRSYEDIAKRLGTPKAVRAVGHANGLNRIGIIIPCHRVVNKNGELGGYGGGLWRKKQLLEIERLHRRSN